MHDPDCPLSHPDGRVVGRLGLDRAGCRRGPASTQPSAAAESSLALVLRAHHWTLQSAVDGAGCQVGALPPPGRPFVMNFDGARLSIHGGVLRTDRFQQWPAPLAGPASIHVIGPVVRSETVVGT